MKIIKCWDIQVWDGGDRNYHKYYVATKEAAMKWLESNKYDSVYEREFMILDSYEELMQYDKGELRKKALAKLTDEERKVLGL